MPLNKICGDRAAKCLSLASIKSEQKRKRKSLVSSPSHGAHTVGTCPFNQKKCVMHEWPVCTDGNKVAVKVTQRPKPGPLLSGQQWKCTGWSETVERLTLQWVPPLAPLLRVECRKFCAGWGATRLTHNHLADKCPPGKHLWISIKVSQAQLLNTWPVNAHLKNWGPVFYTYFNIYLYPFLQSCAMSHTLPICAHFQHTTNGQSLSSVWDPTIRHWLNALSLAQITEGFSTLGMKFMITFIIS